jgi:succinate dehydrogenase hydrophobic anchor subunit
MLNIFFSVNYWLTVRIFKNKSYPLFSSIIVVTFYQFFSILFIFDFLFYQVLDRRDIILERGKISGYIVITVILIFNYIYFNNKNRFQRILNDYKNLNKNKKTLYNILCVMYMILIIVLNVYSAYSFNNNIHWW